MIEQTIKKSKYSAPVAGKPASLSNSQKADAIVKKHTYADKEGNMLLVASDKVYEEMSLPIDDAGAYLGDKNPWIYFKNGLMHTSLQKVLGDLLQEDREEMMVLRKTIKNPEILMFKHQRENKYTLLVPKVYSEFELNSDGEFIDKYIHQDYRVIAFTGQGVPAAFEETFFTSKLEAMVEKMKVQAKKRNVEFF